LRGFGTYTSPVSKGVYLYRFNERTEQLDSLGLAAELANLSFVVSNASHHILYIATEMANRGDAHRGGALSSFAIDYPSSLMANDTTPPVA
jgi:6-phosphogluconolactonase (cycloisomerase 2 family)